MGLLPYPPADVYRPDFAIPPRHVTATLGWFSGLRFRGWGFVEGNINTPNVETATTLEIFEFVSLLTVVLLSCVGHENLNPKP